MKRPPKQAPAQPRDDPGRRMELQRRLEALPEAQRLIVAQLFGLLVRNGAAPRDAPAMLLYWLDRRDAIRNPFAYFARGSAGFLFVERHVRLEADRRTHRAEINAEREGYAAARRAES